MDAFNIIAGICSIIGLIVSLWINHRTVQIAESIKFAQISEGFNLNHNELMSELRAAGLNAIRPEFKNKQLINDFQFKLLSYQKEYLDLFTPEELDHINCMLQLTRSPRFDETEYINLLNEISSKPKIRRT